MVPFVLAGADKGVRGVKDLTFSGGTGSVGDLGLTLLRRLASIPLSAASVPNLLDAIALGLPEIDDDACLAFMVLCSTTNTGVIGGDLLAVEG